MAESRGIIMFNRGEKCILRAIVCLYSLRKWWNGNVTFYLETPYPKEFDDVCKYFGCDIVHNEEKHELRTLARKTDMFGNPPYDRTMWLDSDTIVLGKIDELFDAIDDCDVCIPHFARWISSGHHISARIKRFKGIIDDKYIEEALKDHPAINTGVLSFKKSDKWKKFVEDWVKYSQAGFDKHIFIADEVSFQILYPSIKDWQLVCKISDPKFNVSVLHDHDLTTDPRIMHHHGQKSVLSVKNTECFKSHLKEMMDSNIANINSFLKYADKRLAKYLREGDTPRLSDTTIVTAIDEHYLPILQATFPNWRKYKNIDNNPVIVFINGMELSDPRLDFLKLPNVTLIPWNESCMDKVDSHRELMLSAFVFGVASHVQTDYWLKLDADSYATDNRPFVTEAMKNYSVFSHKWGYSRPAHIKQLDEWAKTSWHKKIKGSKPMMEQGRIEGNRFYHNTKRFISYICFQRTRFTRYCVKLLSTRRLPCPSQDSFAYYCIQKLKPEEMGIGNFKRDYGFTQGRGKMGAEHIRKCVEEVDKRNSNNPMVQNVSQNSETSEQID